MRVFSAGGNGGHGDGMDEGTEMRAAEHFLAGAAGPQAVVLLLEMGSLPGGPGGSEEG